MEGPISNLGLINDVGSGLALTSKKLKKKCFQSRVEKSQICAFNYFDIEF